MSTEHTYQIGDRVRMIGNGHVGKVVGSLGSSPLYPRRVLIESLVDEVRWYCLPADLSPVAPEPTADTEAAAKCATCTHARGEHREPTGLIDNRECKHIKCPCERYMPVAPPAPSLSQEPGPARCATCDHRLYPCTAPHGCGGWHHTPQGFDPHGHFPAAAEPGPAEWWIGDGPLVGPGFLKRWGPFVSRDLAVDMRRFIERDTCSTYLVREFPPAASQEPGETR